MILTRISIFCNFLLFNMSYVTLYTQGILEDFGIIWCQGWLWFCLTKPPASVDHFGSLWPQKWMRTLLAIYSSRNSHFLVIYGPRNCRLLEIYGSILFFVYFLWFLCLKPTMKFMNCRHNGYQVAEAVLYQMNPVINHIVLKIQPILSVSIDNLKRALNLFKGGKD